MKSSLKSFLLKIYGFKFFSAFVLFWPILALMMTEKGASELHITLLLAIWSVFVAIFQPILGMLGDKFSRKIIMFWSQLAMASAFAIFIFSSGFWWLLAAFALWGWRICWAKGFKSDFTPLWGWAYGWADTGSDFWPARCL